MDLNVKKSPFDLSSLPEVFVSSRATSSAVGKALKNGRLRKIASRLYTKNLTEAPEQIVKRNWHSLLRDYFPDALTTSRSMRESSVLKPSDTIIFGEKKNRPDPATDYFMDLQEGMGNDFDKIEHGCHGVTQRSPRAGGSNFVFVDSSVRFLRYGRSVWPVNEWAVSDADRQAYAFQP